MDTDRVAGAAKKVGGKIERGAGQLLGDEGLEAEGVVDEVGGRARQAYGEAKDAVRGYAGQAREAAEDAYDRGRRFVDRRMDDLPDDAERYYRQGRKAVAHQIEESPLTAVVVAGAVGYLLALLVHGRR